MADDKRILLEVKNLMCYFLVGQGERVYAVDHVSFRLGHGKTLGLVGGSDCGKSITARTIIRIYEPTEGHVIFDGQDISHLSEREFRPVRKHMWMIFQDPYASLNARMMVHDILAEPLLAHKLVKSKEGAGGFVYPMPEKVGFTREHANRYVHEFSGGQRQRVGIARALISKLELVICDEPISALDVSIRAQIINLPRDYQEEGGTAHLFIAHNLSMIRYVSDGVGVMYLGQFMELCEVEETYAHPPHPYTWGLLGAISAANSKLARQKVKSSIEGDISSPIHPPSACRFHMGCPFVTEKCKEEEPILKDMGGGYLYAYHLYDRGIAVRGIAWMPKHFTRIKDADRSKTEKEEICMKEKYDAALAALLTLFVLPAGCDEKKSGDEMETVSLGGDAKAESTTEAAKPSGKQEPIFVLSNQPDSLDLSYTNNSFTTPFIVSYFEGLITYDTRGGLVPSNAESWERNEDMTVYTLYPRDGLKWLDGSPLIAEDYAYTAKHVCMSATTIQNLSVMTDYIEGVKEHYGGKGSDDNFGVKAIDNKTLKYRLKAPCPSFVDTVSIWVRSPLQKATIEVNGDKWTQPANAYVCNGPSKILEINPDAPIILMKNENYWDAANVSLEELNLHYILDTSIALTAYENGETDGIRSVPAGDTARLKVENAGLVVVPSYGIVYYNIDYGKEPYNNPLVRKALALAVDRNALINNVVQLDATPACSVLSPEYVVDGRNITEGHSDFDLKSTADLEVVKVAPVEAGYADPTSSPTIQLFYYSDDNAKKVAGAIAEMLTTNPGVKVEVSSADRVIFCDAVQNGNSEIAAMGCSADYLNPMSSPPLLYTNDVVNTPFYSNPTYDAIVDQIRSERDSAKFVELVRKADETVSAEYLVLPPYYKSSIYLLYSYVPGVYMISSGNLYFKNTVVSK